MVLTSIESLGRAASLMARYADRPMDYADATLVVLAEDLGTDRIFTLDRNDFSAFRLHGSQPFRILPSM